MGRSLSKTFGGRRVFITGAAGGIGRATALLAADAGAELVLTDIHEDRLERVVKEIRARDGQVKHAKAVDIADYRQVRDLAEEIHATVGPMDVVMNIAGISAWGTVQNLTHEHWRSMIEVNLMGPIHVIETFVPSMIDAGKGGHVVNVSSAAGLLGLPWHAAYSASKFGLRGVSEVLRFDLRRHGIGVTLVCPGAVDTPLTETVEIAGVDKQSPTFRRFQARFRKHAATPHAVAQAILKGVSRNRYLVHTSTSVRLLHWAERLCPPLYVAVLRSMSIVMTRLLNVAGQQDTQGAQ